MTETTGQVWEGAGELRAFLRPIAELRPHPDNPRRGDVDLVARSLTTFGQLKPIVTDRDDRDLIVAGNHTYMAARDLGWTHLAAVQMWERADSGEKYLLMDNRTSDNSTYDPEELYSMLEDLQGDDLAQSGYTPDDRDRLRQEIEDARRAASELDQASHDDTAGQAAGQVVRNLAITSDDDERWERFTARLGVLKREWGIVGNSETIAEAVRREGLRLHAGTDDTE